VTKPPTVGSGTGPTLKEYRTTIPNKAGVVHAIDIDEGLGTYANGRTARRLANQILDYAASGLAGASRLKYVVYENRIASGTYRKTFWSWRHGNWGA